MKKVLIVLVVLVVALSGFLTWKYFKTHGSGSGKITKPFVKQNLANYDQPFQWGVLVRPYAIGSYDSADWKKEVQITRDLGVNYVRFDWDNSSTFERNDMLIDDLLAKNISPVLIIQRDPNPDYKSHGNYKDGYKDGSTIAAHYKGKIHYYQLMNEVSAMATKNNTTNGQKDSDYDPTKYTKTAQYLRGLSDGVAFADPQAYRIVSIGYTQTGFLDKIVKDGINFDIIGLDWYDWAGDIATVKMDDGQMFSDKLKSFSKPVMFMETNAMPDSTGVNGQKQADFITKTATWAWQNKDFVKGFYVFELVDNVNTPDQNGNLFGIYSATKALGQKGVFGAPRASYTAYQSLIKKYSN